MIEEQTIKYQYLKPKGFMTSLSVISEVMNIPMSAVKCYLRCNGHDDTIEPSSNCIDEKMLEIFDDAYIRKMRNYLSRSIKHIDSLTKDEHADLENYILTFKKQDCKKRSLNTFDYGDIDEEKLRQAFRDRLRNKTKKRSISYLGILDCICVVDAPEPPNYEEIISSLKVCIGYNEPVRLRRELSIFNSQDTNSLLESITRSRYYIANVKIKKTPTYRIDKPIQNAYLSARFHIYIDDDDDFIMSTNEIYKKYYKFNKKHYEGKSYKNN